MTSDQSIAEMVLLGNQLKEHYLRLPEYLDGIDPGHHLAEWNLISMWAAEAISKVNEFVTCKIQNYHQVHPFVLPNPDKTVRAPREISSMNTDDRIDEALGSGGDLSSPPRMDTDENGEASSNPIQRTPSPDLPEELSDLSRVIGEIKPRIEGGEDFHSTSYLKNVRSYMGRKANAPLLVRDNSKVIQLAKDILVIHQKLASMTPVITMPESTLIERYMIEASAEDSLIRMLEITLGEGLSVDGSQYIM
ncbi:hypothetical protein FRC01_003787 [Tulasnella sp. 417]|nr:hypothetical protein FRC01_003787 [Tulasnella sp. 417]